MLIYRDREIKKLKIEQLEKHLSNVIDLKSFLHEYEKKLVINLFIKKLKIFRHGNRHR